MSEKQGWGNICERVDTCALTGAGAFFAAIDKSEVLINGPLWCYFYALRHLEKARPDMYTRFYGSQPDNNDVGEWSQAVDTAFGKQLFTELNR